MYRALAVSVAVGLLTAAANIDPLSYVSVQCIADNSDPLSNDFLVGTWYEMLAFSPSGYAIDSKYCKEIKFNKASAIDIERYKKKYPTMPFSLDDNPVLTYDGRYKGMVSGNQSAKFYILDPDEKVVITEGYKVDAYKRLGDKYILYTPCAWRSQFRWLLSNNRYAPVDEMAAVVRNTTELKRHEYRRYCATYSVQDMDKPRCTCNRG